MSEKYRNRIVSIIVLLIFVFNVIGCATAPKNSKFGFESYSKDTQKDEESNNASTNGAYGMLIGAAAGFAVTYFVMTKSVNPADPIVYVLAILVSGLGACVGGII